MQASRVTNPVCEAWRVLKVGCHHFGLLHHTCTCSARWRGVGGSACLLVVHSGCTHDTLTLYGTAVQCETHCTVRLYTVDQAFLLARSALPHVAQLAMTKAVGGQSVGRRGGFRAPLG